MNRLIKAEEKITNEMIRELAEKNYENITNDFINKEKIKTFSEEANKIFNKILDEVDDLYKLLNKNKDIVNCLENNYIDITEDKDDIYNKLEDEEYDYYNNVYQEYIKEFESYMNDKEKCINDFYDDFETELLYDENVKRYDGDIDKYNSIKSALEKGKVYFK